MRIARKQSIAHQQHRSTYAFFFIEKHPTSEEKVWHLMKKFYNEEIEEVFFSVAAFWFPPPHFQVQFVKNFFHVVDFFIFFTANKIVINNSVELL